MTNPNGTVNTPINTWGYLETADNVSLFAGCNYWRPWARVELRQFYILCF